MEFITQEFTWRFDKLTGTEEEALCRSQAQAAQLLAAAWEVWPQWYASDPTLAAGWAQLAARGEWHEAIGNALPINQTFKGRGADPTNTTALAGAWQARQACRFAAAAMDGCRELAAPAALLTAAAKLVLAATVASSVMQGLELVHQARVNEGGK